MSKKTDSKSNISEPPVSRVCHVSYSLNNDQPVRSTIIGDQPLFYMDFDDQLEDELADFNLLEQELSFGSNRFSTESFADHFDNTAETVLREFQEDLVSLTEGRKKTGPASDIKEVIAELEGSRFAASLAGLAEESGVTVAFSAQEETAVYLRDAGLILVNPNIPFEEQILLLGRELRRVWQHKNGVLLHPLTFHPDQAVLVNRAQVADLTVCMIRIAWELQLNGYREAWDRLEDSPMADLARVFAREAFLDFRTLNNGAAMASTFEMWFLSERCRKYDRTLIQQMLSDYQGYIFDEEDCSRTVTAELVAALGEVPFGKNYLAPYATTIIADPIFADVRDRANANFLWFIKFEKSFRETEQELQSSSGLCGHAGPHDPSRNVKGSNHDTSANVISFPCEDHSFVQNAACARGKKTNLAHQSAEVITFPLFAGKD